MKISKDGILDNYVYSNLDWHDSKKYAWLLSIVPAVIPIIIYGLISWLNYIKAPLFFIHLSYALGPILVFILIPICDWLLGIDGKNAPDEAVSILEEDKYYRIVTYLYFPLMLISLVLCCYLWVNSNMSILDKIFLAWSMGMTSGIGIVSAHELGHKKGAFERWLSKLSLAIPFYGHFYIEHNKGHHVKVATPEDPVSAQMGENVYFYLFRSIPKQIPRAWNLEKSRLSRIGKSKFSLSNDVLNSWLLSVLLWGILTLFFNINILPFLVIQAVVGILLLEFVNYIEHYGLLRQKDEHGRYEHCKPSHSWNSDRLLTNIFLYQLQRHSDHHANPTRRFQSLRSDCSVPELPFGYATSLIYASIPFLWFKIMDVRLMKHYKGDLYKANIYPLAKEKLEFKWLKNKDIHNKKSFRFKVIPFLIIGIILLLSSILGIFLGGYIANIFPFTLIFGLFIFLTCLSALIRGEPETSNYIIPERNNIKRVLKKEIVKNVYQCPGCGYTIDMNKGDIDSGILAGTKWEDISDDWICPDCGVRDKVDFIKIN